MPENGRLSRSSVALQEDDVCLVTSGELTPDLAHNGTATEEHLRAVDRSADDVRTGPEISARRGLHYRTNVHSKRRITVQPSSVQAVRPPPQLKATRTKLGLGRNLPSEAHRLALSDVRGRAGPDIRNCGDGHVAQSERRPILEAYLNLTRHTDCHHVRLNARLQLHLSQEGLQLHADESGNTIREVSCRVERGQRRLAASRVQLLEAKSCPVKDRKASGSWWYLPQVPEGPQGFRELHQPDRKIRNRVAFRVRHLIPKHSNRTCHPL